MAAARTLAAVCVLALPLAFATAPAAAQGAGKGNAFGAGNKRAGGVTSGPSGTGSSAAAAQADGSGVRNFGSWLDDASVITPGSGFMSVAVGYWRLPGFTEFDAPAVDVGIGLTNRVQVGASMPVYHASEPGGPVARGLGDVALNAKIQLRDPARPGGKRIGFAVVPVVEVRSAAAPGESRLTWATPVAVEAQRDGWRTYASAGYFSRGAIFASGALELALTDRVWLTGSISQSRSIRRDDLSAALGLAKVRTDVSGGTTLALSSGLAVFAAGGRTISRRDPNSTNLFVTGGVSLAFAAWRP